MKRLIVAAALLWVGYCMGRAAGASRGSGALGRDAAGSSPPRRAKRQSSYRTRKHGIHTLPVLPEGMPCFKCEDCHCEVDNTTGGFTWAEFQLVLCKACAMKRKPDLDEDPDWVGPQAARQNAERRARAKPIDAVDW